MLVDRLGIVLFALGTTGIVWLASRSPDAPARVRRAPPAAEAKPPALACSTNGSIAEAMQGPFASLGEAVSGELDVKVMRGVAPYDELTVVRVGDGEPDLTNHDRLVLVVQVGGRWFTHELATVGPFCGGMGTPVWVDAEAAAPRILDGAVSVRVHESYHQGDSERAYDSLVECRPEP
jgi:hypothetical protein